MRRLTVISVVALLGLSGCAGAGGQTLAGYCAGRFESLYRNLDISTADMDLEADCDRFIADEGLTTEADIDAWARVAEELLTGWSAS